MNFMANVLPLTVDRWTISNGNMTTSQISLASRGTAICTLLPIDVAVIPKAFRLLVTHNAVENWKNAVMFMTLTVTYADDTVCHALVPLNTSAVVANGNLTSNVIMLPSAKFKNIVVCFGNNLEVPLNIVDWELQPSVALSADAVDGIQSIVAANLVVTNAAIENLKVDKVDVSFLNAYYLTADHIQATYITSQAASIAYATISAMAVATAAISKLQSDKANITDLNASNANISTLETTTASIVNLITNNAGIDHLHANEVLARYAALVSAQLGDAEITQLTAAAINSGTIDTVKVTIAGKDGRLKLANNLMQVFAGTTTLFERIAIGDVNKDGTVYGMRIRGADGTTILFTEDGLTKEGITSGFGKADDNSLPATKIDKESIVAQVNGATTGVKSAHVVVDASGQRLDAKLQTTDETITNQGKELVAHGTEIEALQGSITSKVWNADIKSVTDPIKGDITTIQDNASTLSQTVEGVKSTVTSLDTLLNDGTSGVTTRLAKAEATITQHTDEISSKLEQSTFETYTDGNDTKVTEVSHDVSVLQQSLSQIEFTVGHAGYRNLVLNSAGINSTNLWATTGTVSTLTNSDVNNCTSSNSAFELQAASSISQDIPVKQGDKHTLSFLFKNNSSGGSLTASVIQHGETTVLYDNAFTSTGNPLNLTSVAKLLDIIANTSMIQVKTVQGSNLLNNGSAYCTTPMTSPSGTYVLGPSLGLIPKNYILAGKQLTLSVDVKVTNATARTSGSSRIGVEIAFKRADGTYMYVGAWKTVATGDTFDTRINSTFTLPTDITYDITESNYYIQCLGDVTSVGHAKLAFGTDAVYSPFVPDSPSACYPALIVGTTKVTVNGTDYQLPQEMFDGNYDVINGLGTTNKAKIVLKGTEAWQVQNGGKRFFSTSVMLGLNINEHIITELDHGLLSDIKCTHFQSKTQNETWAGVTGISLDQSTSGGLCISCTDIAADVTTFNNWLAAQYAAGTPVIAVYPLAAPQTITGTAQSLAIAGSITAAADLGTVTVRYNKLTNTDWAYVTKQFDATDTEATLLFKSDDDELISDVIVTDGANIAPWVQSSEELYTTYFQADRTGLTIGDNTTEMRTHVSTHSFEIYRGNDLRINVAPDGTRLQKTIIEDDLTVGVVKEIVRGSDGVDFAIVQ